MRNIQKQNHEFDGTFPKNVSENSKSIVKQTKTTASAIKSIKIIKIDFSFHDFFCNARSFYFFDLFSIYFPGDFLAIFRKMAVGFSDDCSCINWSYGGWISALRSLEYAESNRAQKLWCSHLKIRR